MGSGNLGFDDVDLLDHGFFEGVLFQVGGFGAFYAF